jgi:hypothetical protein
MRQRVNHTKNHVDQCWSSLSRIIYGVGNRGQSRRDVLDWEQLKHCAELAFRSRLLCFEEIKGCYDFDEFVSEYRPTRVEKGIRKQMVLEYQVQDGVVSMRSKEFLDPRCPWSRSVQIFPDLSTPTFSPHAPDKKPDVAPLKEWSYLPLIQRDLTKLYSGNLSHNVVDIPEAVAAGMSGLGLGLGLIVTNAT